MLNAKQAQHLDGDQRASIRYSRATDVAMARKYGVSVATVRLLRRTRQAFHPARIAAGQVVSITLEGCGGGGGAGWPGHTYTVVPATAVRRPKANTFNLPPR